MHCQISTRNYPVVRVLTYCALIYNIGMIELSLDTLAVDADAPTGEMVESGAPPNVHLQVVGGNELPFADPRSGGQRPMQYPSIAVSFQLTKESALKWADLIREKAESLPDTSAKSNITIATDLGEVSKAAEFERKLKGT